MIAITSFMDAPFDFQLGLQCLVRLKCRANSGQGRQGYDSVKEIPERRTRGTAASARDGAKIGA